MLKILNVLKTHTDDLTLSLNNHKIDLLKDDKLLIKAITDDSYDLILLDHNIDILPSIKNADPRIEIIFFGNTSIDAVEAIKKGASAFSPLPVKIDSLKDAVCNIDKFFEVRRETAELERLLNSKYTFAGVVGRNPAMLEVFNFIRHIAPYYRAVTITGATGTGKEVIAKAIHSLSPVSKGPFVVCNCGGMVEGLIESELFGHKKGAFTGAIADKEGLFEAASGGTLFLDEIGELPLSFQPHFLRVLQSGEFKRVGSHQPLKSTCRIIAATNKELANQIKTGKFREDLYYRLTPLITRLPPLSERKDDIPLLCRFLLERFNRRTGKGVFGVSRPAQIALMAHDWPGNVRELESVIEQAAIFTTESFIRLDDIPLYLKVYLKEGKHEKISTPASLDDIIKRHLEMILQHCNGNKTDAAKALGISRRALSRKIQRYKL